MAQMDAATTKNGWKYATIILIVLIAIGVVAYLANMSAQLLAKWDVFPDWLKTNTASIVGSFMIGATGSGAYYASLRLGFTGGIYRDSYLKNFGNRFGIVGFVIIGGGVAVVFQLAQISTFTPVQSFVLGITWPMIVAQYSAVKAETSTKSLADRIRG